MQESCNKNVDWWLLVDLKTRCPLFLVCLSLLFVGVTYNSLE